MKLRVFLFLLFISHHTLADDWESIIKTSDVEVLVNLDSYNMEDGYPIITTQYRYKKQQQEPTQKPYWVKKTTAQYNCLSHMIKPTKIIFLDKKFKEVGQKITNKQFKPAVGNDIQVETLVCQVHKMLGGN